jgi:hypothetical protein
VLWTTPLSYGNMPFLDLRPIITPWPIDMKFYTIDYVGEVTRCVKNYNNRFSGVFSPYRWNIRLRRVFTFFFFLFFDKPTDRTRLPIWTILPQSTQIFSRKCLLGVWIFAKNYLGVIFAPKNWKNFLTIAQAWNSWITFERRKINGKFQQNE